MKKVSYEPIPVSKILLQMKNTSSLMLDLAFSAVMFNDEDLSAHVATLEEKVDHLSFLLRVHVCLAARDKDDALKSVGLLQVAAAADRISNAAADISEVVFRKLGFPRLLQAIMEEVDEKVAGTKVRPESSVAGEELGVITEALGIDVIALERGDEWFFDPKDSFIPLPDDILIARGTEESIEALFLVASEKLSFEEIQDLSSRIPKISSSLENLSPEEKKLVGLLADLKDKSELMIDLAFSSLIFNSIPMAKEVAHLEEEVDELYTELGLLALKLPTEDEASRRRAFGLIRFSVALEDIADSAYLMSELLIRGFEGHPLLRKIVDGSDETLTLVQVEKDSNAIEKPIEDLEAEMGTWVVALRRENAKKFKFDPPDHLKIREGDILVCKAFKKRRGSVLSYLGSETDEDQV